jgi:hypothetical protein
LSIWFPIRSFSGLTWPGGGGKITRCPTSPSGSGPGDRAGWKSSERRSGQGSPVMRPQPQPSGGRVPSVGHANRQAVLSGLSLGRPPREPAGIRQEPGKNPARFRIVPPRSTITTIRPVRPSNRPAAALSRLALSLTRPRPGAEAPLSAPFRPAFGLSGGARGHRGFWPGHPSPGPPSAMTAVCVYGIPGWRPTGPPRRIARARALFPNPWRASEASFRVRRPGWPTAACQAQPPGGDDGGLRL